MTTVISTQMPEQFERLNNLIGDKVNLINMPMIKVEQHKLTDELKLEINRADTYNWIIFTSMKAVEFFFNIYDKGVAKLRSVKFACIGSSTQRKLAEYNIKTDYLNEGNTSIELSNNLIYRQLLLPSDRVMHPTSNKASNKMRTYLNKFCNFKTVVIYNTIEIKEIDKIHLELLKNKQYELILFTSPSAFINFVDITKLIVSNEDMKIAAIGDITNNAINKLGYQSTLVASKANIETVAQEIMDYLEQPTS